MITTRIKRYLIVAAVLLVRTGLCQDKYTDETRPYKFGFNIEGYQHRQEEKDEKGIIKGEYGFITADGYYRVTVYATDENGDFRIISMKNYYVGFPPEDPQTTPQPPSSSSRGAQQNRGGFPPAPNPLSASPEGPRRPEAGQRAKTPIEQTGLTACSDCLIPTTKKPEPQSGGRGDFGSRSPGRGQGPVFGTRNRGGAGDVPGGFGGPGGIGQRGGSGVNPPNPAGGRGSTKFRGSNQGGSGDFQQSRNGGGGSGTGGRRGGGGGGSSPGRGSGGSAGGEPQGPGSRFTSSDVGFGGRTGTRDGFPGGDPQQRRPAVGTVRDGLPRGVTMDDIKALLYRFNYTVGFHGHHEDGYRNGDKEGDYFFDGRDGVERRVEYIANEFGYQPNITFVDLAENDVRRPNERTEKEFGLKGYEFKWFYRK